MEVDVERVLKAPGFGRWLKQIAEPNWRAKFKSARRKWMWDAHDTAQSCECRL